MRLPAPAGAPLPVRVALLLALPVICVVALDFMATLVGPPLDTTFRAGPVWTAPVHFWAQRGFEAGGTPGTVIRQLELSAPDGQIHASYDVWLPATDALYQAVERDEHPDDTAELVNDLLGAVQVGEFPLGFGKRVTAPLTFERPVATRDDPAPGTGHIHLDADPYNPVLPDVDVRVARADDLAVGVDRIVVHNWNTSVAVKPAAVTYRSGTATIDRAAAGDGDLVVAHWRELRDENVLAALRRFGGAAVPVVGFDLNNLMSAVPAVAVLLWLRRYRRRMGVVGDRLVRAALLCTALPLAAAFIGAVLDVEIAVGPFAQSALPAWAAYGQFRPDDAGEAEAIALVFVAVLLPIGLWAGTRDRGPSTVARPRHRAIDLAALAACAAVESATVAWFLTLSPAPWPARIAMALAWLALSVVVGLSVAIIAGLLSARRPWLLAAVVLTALDGAVDLQRLLDPVNRYAGYLTPPQRIALGFAPYTVNVDRIVAFGAAAVLVVCGYAYLVGRTATLAARSIGARRAALVGLASFVGLLVAAILPVSSLLSARGRAYDIGVNDLLGFMQWLTSLNWFLLTGLVLLALRALTRGGRAGPEAGARTGALLFAVLTFYWDDRWAYLPVTFLVGLAVTNAVLRRSPQDVDGPVLRRLIERATLLDLESRALRRRRFELLTALEFAPYGEIDDIDKARRRVEARISALPADDPPVDVLLHDRWRHGRHGAVAGLAVGLPWTVIYLSQLRSQSMGTDRFDGLYYASSVVWTIVSWSTIGFFFGFAYPWLRGGNGMAKACALVVAVACPPLVLQFINSEPADWRGVGVFALQVLVFAMVLGVVVGDLALLAPARLGWRYVVDVYNARFAAVWASAFVVAIGAIVTAGLTSGLEELATYLIGQIHLAPPPTGGR